jgi:hypothetical protein
MWLGGGVLRLKPDASFSLAKPQLCKLGTNHNISSLHTMLQVRIYQAGALFEQTKKM